MKLILDNVLESLLDTQTEHDRTFTYVEMKFFSKWYLSLPDSSKQSLKDLIAKGQFSFANGGWSMHDEASTHFMGMIDQTTLGHTFLKKELGVVPTVGWQIDPFGHSATQGGLMTSGMGFDALYFGRQVQRSPGDFLHSYSFNIWLVLFLGPATEYITSIYPIGRRRQIAKDFGRQL